MRVLFGHNKDQGGHILAGHGLDAASFSPADLFANGENGSWFDFSTSDYIWQSSTGETPVTADSDPAGLALDKSQGVRVVDDGLGNRALTGLGPELVTNGGFDTDTDWTKGTGWAISGGAASINTASSFVVLSQNISATAGDWYIVECDVTITSGSIKIGVTQFGGDGIPNTKLIVGSGSYSFFVIGSGTNVTIRTETGPTNASIGNISVRKISGNHAYQLTNADRRAWSSSGYLSRSDGDRISATLPNLGNVATLAYATPTGVVITTDLSLNGATNLPDDDLSEVVYLDRALATSETISLHSYLLRHVAAFDFFVDATNGSDANPGTSQAAAFATLSAAASAVSANESIGLKRGETWEEELNLSTKAGVRVGAYGSLAQPLPKIECTDVNASWSKTGGRTNVYEVSWSHDLTSTQTRHFVYEDGERMQYVADVATCDSTAGSYTYTGSANTSPITIYVHTTGSGNPSSNGSEYRITKRQYSVFASGGGVLVDSVHGTRQAHNDGSIVLMGDNSEIRNCLATWGQKHHFFVWAVGGRVTNCVGYLGYSPFENSTTYVAYHDDTSVTNGDALFRYCYARPHSSDTRPIAESIEAFYAHTSGGTDNIALMDLQWCFAHGVERAFSGAVDEIKASNSISEECRHLMGGGSNQVIDNAVCISTNAVVGINQARVINSGGGTSCTISDLRAANDGSSSAFIGLSSGSALSVSSSTILFVGRVITDQAGNVTANDNVFLSQKFYDRSAGKTLTAADRNAFDTSAPVSDYIIDGTTYSDLASYQTAYPAFDANSAEAADIIELVDALANDWTVGSVADTGGRSAGSRKHIGLRDWTALKARWESGFLGIDGTGA